MGRADRAARPAGGTHAGEMVHLKNWLVKRAGWIDAQFVAPPTVTLTGKIGAGNVTKLANQIMVAVNIAAMGEALVLATKAGLDPEVVFNAVKAGLAGSTVLNVKAPMVYSRNFKPGFRVRLHQKDLRNALLAAESLKVSLPLTSAVQNMLIDLMNNGKGDLDHSAIVQITEEASAVEVKKPA